MEADEEFFNSLTLDNIEEYATREESTVQTVKPDKDGNLIYDYEIKGEIAGEVSDWIKDVSEYKVGQLIVSGCGTREKGETFVTFVYNGDGTFTGAVYRLK